MSACESLYDNIPDRFIIDKFHEFSRFIMSVAIKADMSFALRNKEKLVGWRGEKRDAFHRGDNLAEVIFMIDCKRITFI